MIRYIFWLKMSFFGFHWRKILIGSNILALHLNTYVWSQANTFKTAFDNRHLTVQYCCLNEMLLTWNLNTTYKQDATLLLTCVNYVFVMQILEDRRHRSSKNNIFKSSKSFSGRKMMLCLGCNIFFEVASCFDYNLFFNTFSCTFSRSATKMLMLSILNWTKTFVLKQSLSILRNKRLGKSQTFFYNIFIDFLNPFRDSENP